MQHGVGYLGIFSIDNFFVFLPCETTDDKTILQLSFFLHNIGGQQSSSGNVSILRKHDALAA